MIAFLPAEVVLAVQATMLSLVPPEIVPPSDTRKGVSPPALQPLLSWFQHTFQQLPPALSQSPDEDAFAGRADGTDSVTEQLQAAAVAKQGSAEQLQVLFVSLCRAQALLVRSVRCDLSKVKVQSMVLLLYVLHSSLPYTACFCGDWVLHQGAEGTVTNQKQTMNSCIVYMLHSLRWAGSVL